MLSQIYCPKITCFTYCSHLVLNSSGAYCNPTKDVSGHVRKYVQMSPFRSHAPTKSCIRYNSSISISSGSCWAHLWVHSLVLILFQRWTLWVYHRPCTPQRTQHVCSMQNFHAGRKGLNEPLWITSRWEYSKYALHGWIASSHETVSWRYGQLKVRAARHRRVPKHGVHRGRMFRGRRTR